MRRGVKKAQQGLFCLLLIGLALCLAMPVTVCAEDVDMPDVVTDMAGLQAWLDKNPKGGTITLAAGIEITEPVRLYLCRVEAESQLSLPDCVTLDTCIVSPFISGGTVISRKISNITPLMPLLLYLGEIPADFFASNPLLCNITLAAEGVAGLSEKVHILFDDRDMNYNKPGEYLLPGVLEPPYDEFDLVASGSPLSITVTIYDPAIPYFYASGEIFGSFSISYYYDGKYEDLTLWRSDDGGASWYVYWTYDALHSEKFTVVDEEYCFHLIFTDPAELAAPALFVFEVGEGVGSDILFVDAKNVGIGGDRDSGDRIWLPWEFFFSNPGDDDGGGGNEYTGGNTTTPPNTGVGTSNPGDEGNQGLDGNDTNNGNGTNNGDNGNEGNTTPHTQPAPQQPAKSALIDLPAIFTPATALAITNTVPLDPPLAEETVPLESPGENQPPQSAPQPEPQLQSAPQPESEPEPVPQPEPQPESQPESQPQPVPEPQPEPPQQVIPSSTATNPAPVFPIWAAGLMGAGGVSSLGYALHKRRRGR